jgi:hypothetical protein
MASGERCSGRAQHGSTFEVMPLDVFTVGAGALMSAGAPQLVDLFVAMGLFEIVE